MSDQGNINNNNSSSRSKNYGSEIGVGGDSRLPSFRYVIGTQAGDNTEAGRSFSPINTPRARTSFPDSPSQQQHSAPNQQENQFQHGNINHYAPQSDHQWNESAMNLQPMDQNQFMSSSHNSAPPVIVGSSSNVQHQTPYNDHFFGNPRAPTGTHASMGSSTNVSESNGFTGFNSHLDSTEDSNRQLTPSNKKSKKTGRPRGRPKGSVKLGRPKRPLSAYNLFFKEERENILKSMAEKALEDAKVTNNNHEDTKVSNSDDKGAETTGNDNKNTQGNASPAAVPDIPNSSDSVADALATNEIKANEADNSPPKQKKRGRPRGPNYSEKKPPHGKISFEQLAKMIGPKWKTLDPEILSRFTAIAQKEKERYRKELDAYNAKNKAKKEAEEAAAAIKQPSNVVTSVDQGNNNAFFPPSSSQRRHKVTGGMTDAARQVQEWCGGENHPTANSWPRNVVSANAHNVMHVTASPPRQQDWHGNNSAQAHHSVEWQNNNYQHSTTRPYQHHQPRHDWQQQQRQEIQIGMNPQWNYHNGNVAADMTTSSTASPVGHASSTHNGYHSCYPSSSPRETVTVL